MKNLLLIIAVGLFAFPSQAQSRFGMKGGLSITSMKSEGWDNKQPKMGTVFGILVEKKLKGNFFFKHELIWSRKGFRFDEGYQFTNGVLNLNYLSLPLLLGYRPAAKLAFVAGPEFAFLLRANSRFNNSSQNVTNGYTRYEICLNAGAQYQLSKQLVAELRLSHGIIDVNGAVVTHPLIDYIGVYKAKNQALQLNVFYLFSRK